MFVLGGCGFLIAKHIHNHKTKNKPLICPGRSECHAVIHSNYAEIFGVQNEVFGMIYYAFISLSFLLVFILTLYSIPADRIIFVIFLVFIASLVSVLYSIYLLGVQIFILKKSCIWCIISSFISILIFILLFI